MSISALFVPVSEAELAGVESELARDMRTLGPIPATGRSVVLVENWLESWEQMHILALGPPRSP